MNDAARSLEDHLIETAEPINSGDERFAITDEGGAEWALRKVAQKRRHMAANAAQAKDVIERTTAWLEEVNGPLQKDAEFLEAMLVEFHRAQLDEDENRKSIKLPAGTLKSRKQPAKWEINDEAAFIKWAKENDDCLVRVKEEPDKANLKKLYVVNEQGYAVDAETGEVVPGVHVIDGEIRFTVDVEVEVSE